MVTRYPQQARQAQTLPAQASQTQAALPVRTCVGCRGRAVKSDLLRLVASGDEIVPDVPGRRPGRGAYLHPCRGCFEKAQRRRAFARALRQPGPLGTGRLAEYLDRQDDDGVAISSVADSSVADSSVADSSVADGSVPVSGAAPGRGADGSEPGGTDQGSRLTLA